MGYVIVLPPEKMVTIYDTFVRNEHPMKHILLDYQTATVLMQGIVEALSNEERTVSANINIENRNKPNYSESAATFSLKINDPKILDELEKLPYSGELLKIDKLKDFSVKAATAQKSDQKSKMLNCMHGLKEKMNSLLPFKL